MRQLNSSNKYGSGSKTTKGEGKGAGFKAKKNWFFFDYPNYYYYLFINFFFGNFDAVGLSWPSVVKEIISCKFIKHVFI